MADISVVMPAKNEAAAIGGVVKAIRAQLEGVEALAFRYWLGSGITSWHKVMVLPGP